MSHVTGEDSIIPSVSDNVFIPVKASSARMSSLFNSPPRTVRKPSSKSPTYDKLNRTISKDLDNLDSTHISFSSDRSVSQNRYNSYLPTPSSILNDQKTVEVRRKLT